MFQTIDPETYDDMRRHIMFNLAYKIVLSDQVAAAEERAYQQQVDKRVEAWRQNIPDTAIDFLITTAK